MSRSIAVTLKPVSANSAVWRPVPQATSSTVPPAVIRDAKRRTQGDGGAMAYGSVICLH